MSLALANLSESTRRIEQFVEFVRTHIRGDEKGEAQIFCDRLFRAFGHEGIMEAGGTLEFRVRKVKGTRFADLLWKPRLLLEMKKRGEKLERHYQQAFDYWLNLVPNRPRYVVLCNFDEFWIYDFDHQLYEPMDRVRLDELPARQAALNFLFPEERRPVFNNDRVAVTRTAARKMALLFNQLVHRSTHPVARERAQRFVLQCVVALFAEDSQLLPRSLFTEMLGESRARGNTFDVIGGLFRQMASPTPSDGGWYRDVPYFNGGLFTRVEPVELHDEELELLASASAEGWDKVHPAIFGSLFEGSLSQAERHAYGAHFTSEADIYKVVLPTIIRPWRELIAGTRGTADLLKLRERLLAYRVLDPACGSGNFLYVAYRELKRVELELLEKIYASLGRSRQLSAASQVSASQFYGIDIEPFAVELAKVTLMIGKTLALRETTDRLAAGQQHLPFDLTEQPLPLDNLDRNFVVGDALIGSDGTHTPWPRADVIIGNPPFLGAKRLKPLRGAAYVNLLRGAYADVPGMADYCVYWLRRSHDHLPECSAQDPVAGRAGLVATQNIRSNQSRVAGLDHVAASGTIVEAVDNQPWSGEANVHVSIVNWVKTRDASLLPARRRLWSQPNASATRAVKRADSDRPGAPELVLREVARINSDLSDAVDVSRKVRLACNLVPKRCFQGKIPGYDGFLVGADEARRLRGDSAPVIRPYLTGRELLDEFRIERWVIDFGKRDMVQAAQFRSAFEHCREQVLPAVEQSLRDAEAADSDMAAPRREHLGRWWQLWNRRDEMSAALAAIPRYIGCSRVTRRPVMVFLSSAICPSDLVQVFAFDDDYSFGILQSGPHFEWFRKSSRLKVESDLRYSVREVFETFPWPQSPTKRQVERVAEAGRRVRQVRVATASVTGGGLRSLYRMLDLPGKHPLRTAHQELDAAVRDAYGMRRGTDPLGFLLELNQEVSAAIGAGAEVQRPGLPAGVDPAAFVTDDAYTATEP